jgi:polyisoprenoid-binding protein YceI
VSATVTAGIGPFQNEVAATTRSVDGSVTIVRGARGNVLNSSEFTAQTADLTTGDGLTDDQLRSILDTARYPTAHFEQTSPTDLPDPSALRAGAEVTLHGNLTMHGATHLVSIPARATLAGSTITVVASVPFRLADYDIQGSGFVSVGDVGAIDVRLVLTR